MEAKQTFKESFITILGIIFIIFLVGWTAAKTFAPLGIVFISFLPVLITIAISYMLFAHGTKYKIMAWIVPLFGCMIFYAAATSGQVPMLEGIEYANITALNFFLSIAFLILLDFSAYFSIQLPKKSSKKSSSVSNSHNHTKYNQQSHLEKKIKEDEGEKRIETYIQSVEDKAKAINFVIGRVYSNKHGGSPDLRLKIRIKKEWYSVFAQITSTKVNDSLPALKTAVYDIGNRLNVLFKAEKDVFNKTELSKLNEIERNPYGEDKIIDVLVANDKDPVKTYYQSAVEFCNKAAKEIDGLIKHRPQKESKIVAAHSTLNLSPKSTLKR